MIKYIIYKEGEKIKGTTADNYHAMIQDANKLRTFRGFTSLKQAKKYMVTFTTLNNDEIETIEKEGE